jgi:parallel beta-helix repeat protein
LRLLNDPLLLSTLASPACTVVQGTLVLSGDSTGCFTITTGAILDLNGFTLTGNVFGVSRPSALSPSYGATLRNGTLTNGYINFALCENCVIDNVRVINGVPNPSFPNSSVVPGDDTQISRCFFSGNGDTVDLFFASAVITASKFENNGLAINIFASTAVIKASTFENNDLGIYLSWADGSTISSNQFRRNGAGVTIAPEHDEPGAFSNTVAYNEFAENGNGVSFFLGVCLPGGIPASCMRGNVVSRNLFFGNRGSGLRFDTTSCGSDPSCLNISALIEKNLFLVNGFATPQGDDDNGLTVVGPSSVNNGVTLTGNIAVLNKDLGIDAAGVIDGGGNLAILNGNPLQCVGVACNL